MNFVEIVTMKLKHMKLQKNGRSSDYIINNLIYGCPLGGAESTDFHCMYCYTKRFQKNMKKYPVEQAITLLSSADWGIKIPNQTDPKFWTVDVACHTDPILTIHSYPWIDLFNWFKSTVDMKATMATKFTSKTLLNYDSRDKDGNHRLRVRTSLMPSLLSKNLEPGTASIKHRLDFAEKLKEKNQIELHINFSPVVFCKDWLNYYKELFELVKERDLDVPCEVIMLTGSDEKHKHNLKLGFKNEHLLYNQFQEPKITTYKTNARRYKYDIKKYMIYEFKKLYSEFFEESNIRYIF
jgi:spore photoproduct lyase